MKRDSPPKACRRRKLTLAILWRDWFNDFLTEDRFAEYYMLSLPVAKRVIRWGFRRHHAELTPPQYPTNPYP